MKTDGTDADLGIVVSLHQDRVELVAQDVTPEEARSLIHSLAAKQQLAAFFPVAAASAAAVIQIINQTGIIARL